MDGKLPNYPLCLHFFLTFNFNTFLIFQLNLACKHFFCHGRGMIMRNELLKKMTVFYCKRELLLRTLYEFLFFFELIEEKTGSKRIVLIFRKATGRKKWESVAVCRRSQEEHTRVGLSRTTNVPTMNKREIVQASEEIERKLWKKISEQFD